MDKIVRKNPVAAMIFANVFLGLNSVLAKIGYESIPPFVYVGLRYVFASSLLLTAGWYIKETFDKKDTSNLIINSTFSLVAALTFFSGLTMTQAVNAALLFLLAPLFVYVGSILFLGEPRSNKALSGSMLAFAGGIMLFGSPSLTGGGDPQEMIGNGLIFISVVAFAGNILHSKKIITENNIRTILGVRGLVVGVVSLVIAFIFENPVEIFDATPRSLAALLMTITVSGAFGVLLYYKALEHMRAEDSASIFYIDPLVGSLGGAIILGETLNDAALIAAGLIVAGVLIAHPVHIQRTIYYQKFKHSKFEDFVHWARKEYDTAYHLIKKYF